MITRCKNHIEVQTLLYRTFDKLDDFTIKHHARLGGPAIDDSLGLSLYFLNFPISLNIMIE